MFQKNITDFIVVVVSDPPTRRVQVSWVVALKRAVKEGVCGLSLYLDRLPKMVCRLGQSQKILVFVPREGHSIPRYLARLVAWNQPRGGDASRVWTPVVQRYWCYLLAMLRKQKCERSPHSLRFQFCIFYRKLSESSDDFVLPQSLCKAFLCLY